MPTYDYKCSACKQTYELRESFSAPMEHGCQECGKGIAKRLLTVPTVVFKGSGWYVNDSRGKSDTTDEAKPTTSLPEAAKSDAPAKSESAPASTPAPAASTPAAST